MRLPWKHHPMNPDRIKPPPPPAHEEPWRMNLIPMPKKKTEEEDPMSDKNLQDYAVEPQIIRTMEELEALDPDTAITLYEWESTIWPASYFQRCFDDDGYIPDLPATVIATGPQVRAARKALERDND